MLEQMRNLVKEVELEDQDLTALERRALFDYSRCSKLDHYKPTKGQLASLKAMKRKKKAKTVRKASKKDQK